MAIAQFGGEIVQLKLPEDIHEEKAQKEEQELVFYTPKFGCTDEEAEEHLRHMRQTNECPKGIYGTQLEWFMSWVYREENTKMVEGYGFTAKQVVDICIGVADAQAA